MILKPFFIYFLDDDELEARIRILGEDRTHALEQFQEVKPNAELVEVEEE